MQPRATPRSSGCACRRNAAFRARRTGTTSPSNHRRRNCGWSSIPRATCGEISRRRMERVSLAIGILVAVLASAGIGAVNIQLTTQDIQRATELARWPHTDAERAQFHKRYTVAVNGPAVDYFVVEAIEVTTP